MDYGISKSIRLFFRCFEIRLDNYKNNKLILKRTLPKFVSGASSAGRDDFEMLHDKLVLDEHLLLTHHVQTLLLILLYTKR